jgi:hypothetical protein
MPCRGRLLVVDDYEFNRNALTEAERLLRDCDRPFERDRVASLLAGLKAPLA